MTDMRYPHLDTLMHGYLNQDYDYYADTVEGVIAAYMNEVGPQYVQGVRDDVANFLRDHSDALEEAFEAAYGFDFDPKLWDLTARSFLENLDRQLSKV